MNSPDTPENTVPIDVHKIRHRCYCGRPINAPGAIECAEHDDAPKMLMQHEVLTVAGEVRSYLDGHLQEVVRVQARLHDQALRQAVVAELERLGYTVIPPTKEPRP